MAFKSMLRVTLGPALAIVVALAAIVAPAAAEPYRIVGFGDSLMAGYELGAGEGFPARLESALKARGHDVAVADAGVSGDTSSGGLSRLDWSVPDGTNLVILELGANDMLRGIAPELTESNLDRMISRLKQRGIAVLLAGMVASPNLGPDYVNAFNAIYPRLARKHGLALVPFFLEGVAGNRRLQLSDGMHPNAAGVETMVKNVLPAVELIVGAAQADG